MTTTFQEFLAAVQNHLVNHGQSPSLLEDPTMLNALRVGVTVVQLASANRLRRMILETEKSSAEQYVPRPVDVEDVLGMLNKELFDGYREANAIGRDSSLHADLNHLASLRLDYFDGKKLLSREPKVVVETTPGASTPRIPSMFSQEEIEALQAIASFDETAAFGLRSDLISLGRPRPDADVVKLPDPDFVDDSEGTLRPKFAPPTERTRVGSGIYFSDESVKAMEKCDCCECPNGCRACQRR